MMNYEIFKEVVKEKFMDYMPEKFKGMELVAEPVEKVNVTLISLFWASVRLGSFFFTSLKIS